SVVPLAVLFHWHHQRPVELEIHSAIGQRFEAANREYRYVATLALRERGLAAREALPVLIESLNDPYYLVRMGVVKTLGQLGSEAKPAVPALTRLLGETSDEPLRRALVHALQNVEPGNTRQVEEE